MKIKLTCHELTQTLTHDETKWTFADRVRMKFHLMICNHCTRYAKSIESLKIGVRSYFERSAPLPEQTQKLETQILEDLKKDPRP